MEEMVAMIGSDTKVRGCSFENSLLNTICWTRKQAHIYILGSPVTIELGEHDVPGFTKKEIKL